MAVENCKYFNICGSCAYQLTDYQASLKDKQKNIEKLFPEYTVSPIVGMDNPYGYRCKVTVTFSMFKGKLTAGVYQKDSHKVLPVTNCALHQENANKVLNEFLNLANKYKYFAYNEDNRSGQLRHLQFRVNYQGKVLVTIVYGSKSLPNIHNFINELKDKCDCIIGILANQNNKKTSMILADRQKVLLGKNKLIDQMDDLSFSMSNNSFYQVNLVNAYKCYKYAIDGLNLTKQDTLLDAYCGTGTIGLLASKYCKSVMGVEINRMAIIDAKNNALMNNIKNISFKALNVDDYVMNTHFDKIIIDPPRSGCSQKFLYALVKNNPNAISYISCNPITQVRDIKYLTKNNYKVISIQPVDMFCFTNHIENVVVMTKVE